MSVDVSLSNFATAETALQFDRIVGYAGGTNRFFILREPVQVEVQPVIRMQRDTLYAAAIIDISEGAVLILPDSGDRYLSAHVINEHHFTTGILHEPGSYRLTTEDHETPFVYVIVRILVDPTDPDGLRAVHALQDALSIDAQSDREYSHPEYDQERYDALYALLLALGDFVPDSAGAFGSRDEVDPVAHLVNTAIGWGGLPEREAVYQIDGSPRPIGHYQLRLEDVPADGFWSLSIYNRDGYFEANPYGAHNLNSITATPSDDGKVVIHLAPEDQGFENFLYVMDGWNFVFRLYQPRSEVLDDGWRVPDFIEVD